MAIWFNNRCIIWTLGGTAFLIGLGWILRLVGVEYDLQKKEAAYRKILVVQKMITTLDPKLLMNYLMMSDQFIF